MSFAILFNLILLLGIGGVIIHSIREEISDYVNRKILKTYFKRILRLKDRKPCDCESCPDCI